MASTIQIAVAGALGRMGRRVLELAANDPRFQIAAAMTRSGDPKSGSSVHFGSAHVAVTERLGTACDVLIDFSDPVGTLEWLSVCERLELPMVTGVTGHTEDHKLRLREAARVIPIVAESNFSIGMSVLLEAVELVSARLGKSYDVEIVETHHRQKVDAPSGSALKILQQLTALGSRKSDVVFGRHGRCGPRPEGQIGVHSIRLGDVVGQHEVKFCDGGETLTISHAIQTRDTFAWGSLQAAEWVVGRPPGLYSLQDMLASKP